MGETTRTCVCGQQFATHNPIHVYCSPRCRRRTKARRANGVPLDKPYQPARSGCEVPACDGKHEARGLCVMHYQRLKSGKPLNDSREVHDGTQGCSIDGCDRPHHSLGLCGAHYQRHTNGWAMDGPVYWHRFGDENVCDVAGCGRKHRGNGLCTMHYQRLRDQGDVGSAGSTRAENGSGYINAQGYHVGIYHGHPLARVRDLTLTHRVVLYEKVGPGEHPCHWCGVTVSWDIPGSEPGALHTDHIDWDRLNNEPTNLVPSCAPCNSTRWKGSGVDGEEVCPSR